MELKEVDDVASFLGVHIDHPSGGTIHLTQKGLIDRFIKALNIRDLHQSNELLPNTDVWAKTSSAILPTQPLTN
jgi:hypothetical protein